MDAQPQAADLERASEVFTEVRPRLFGIAYRMLGSVAEAEDIVQDAWIRWQSTDRETIETPAAYLTTVTTRLAINVTQSARVRRETYIGPWLPEPVDTSSDPSLGAERDAAVEMALLFLMEKLPPKERAAYILREAFDYGYDAIAELLETTPANSRQLVTRARKHIGEQRSGTVSTVEHRRLLQAFLDAAQTGDVAAMEEIFAIDVASYSDGGGVAKLAARIPVLGRERVAKFVAAWSTHFWADTTVTWMEANGLPAAVVSRDGEVLAMLNISVSEDRIDQIMWVMNPEKLTAASRLAS